MLRWAVLVGLLTCFVPTRAYADIGVVLNESLDTSFDRITGTGHSAVYFSRVCPDSPVHLRLCRPGESGSVISTYMNIGEDQPFGWNVAPLNVYLYGVEDPQNRPLFGSPEIKRVLEERYRDKYLTGYCDNKSCRTGNDAEWRYMVGATLARGVYIFMVETSLQQDLDFIERFNAQPNVNHFNGIRNNCADFTKDIINSYFPHATKREYINDFGVTTPKAVARSFTHYALRHPELRLRILHFAQVPGTIKRSREVRSGTEQLVHSKKLLVPMAIFAHYEMPFVAASYLLTGRFNPEREAQQHPLDAAETNYEIQLARAGNDYARLHDLKTLARQERADAVGTRQGWNQYAASYDLVINQAIHEEIIPSRDYLTRVFRHMDKDGTPVADANGAIWLEIVDPTGIAKLGVSASNILAFGSDSRLACEFLLARANFELKSPLHGREDIRDFRTDWTLLKNAQTQYATVTLTSNVPITHIRTAGND